MPNKVVKAKVKTKKIVKAKPRAASTATAAAASSYDIQAVGRRHLIVRNGADGLELELLVATDGGDRHLATLVFEAGEAGKLRDGLAALVK